METEATGVVKVRRGVNRKVYGYVTASLKMWRFKRQYKECLEDVRRRRLELSGGELALANRLLSFSENAPPARRVAVTEGTK